MAGWLADVLATHPRGRWQLLDAILDLRAQPSAPHRGLCAEAEHERRPVNAMRPRLEVLGSHRGAAAEEH